jgi:hypothetical protein
MRSKLEIGISEYVKINVTGGITIWQMEGKKSSC